MCICYNFKQYILILVGSNNALLTYIYIYIYIYICTFTLIILFHNCFVLQHFCLLQTNHEIHEMCQLQKGK